MGLLLCCGASVLKMMPIGKGYTSKQKVSNYAIGTGSAKAPPAQGLRAIHAVKWRFRLTRKPSLLKC
jgi:hypothetical protein